MLRKLSILLLGLVTVACQNSRGTIGDDGFVGISLNTDSLEVVVSKAAPSVSEFALRVENTRGENLREWASIDQVPEIINMMPGSYRFVAYCGSAEGYPSWTAGEYWQGEHKFALAAGEKVDVPLVVKSGLTKVLVNFDETFNRYYSAYSADVRTTTPTTPDAGLLNYTVEDEGHQGAFLPGTLRLRMRLTSLTDGKDYLFSPPTPIGTAHGAERYTINLTVAATSGEPVLSVDFDGTVTLFEIKVENLPSSILPKAAPRVRATNFDLTNPLIYNEGVAPTDKLAAAIDAPAGLKSLKIVASGAALNAAWAGVQSIELMGIGLPENNEKKELLLRSGFEWSEALNTLGTDPGGKGLQRAEVRLNGIFHKLTARLADGAQGSDYSFSIEATDLFDQKSSLSGNQFLVKATITPPVFNMTAPTEGNVWARMAEFELNYTANVAGAEPYVEVKKGDGMWSRFEQSYIETATGVHYQTVRGLEPLTQYSFRTVFGEHRGEQEYTFTTEKTTTVPNGDMESWNAYQLGTSTENLPFYEPWTGTAKYWDTNNSQTTASHQWPVTGQTCFPAVSYTMNAFNGKFSAEIRSVGAGWGNTLNICYDGSKVAGRMFVGSYGDNGRGLAFDARPVKLQFYHTYANYNNDSFDAVITLWSGEVQIGQGTYTSVPGRSVTDYELAQVDINYTVRNLRADKMTIVFRSTTKGQAEVRKLTYDLDYLDDPDYNKGWKAYIGSVLRVDDVSLVY